MLVNVPCVGRSFSARHMSWCEVGFGQLCLSCSGLCVGSVCLITRLNVVGALIHLEAAGPPTQREVACGRGSLGVRPILG